MRWFYSTDARDIGILYLLLSAFSGILGTSMSMYIRLHLMDINQSAVLHFPNQLYNNVITVHAILMIFFLVMPAMFGAFGKKIKNIQWSPFLFSSSLFNKNFQSFSTSKFNFLDYYLTGLIEADGSIVVSKKNQYFPKIVIIFQKKDRPLAEYLQSYYQCGQILNKKTYFVWQIQRIKEVLKIIHILNGKMRTPKIWKLKEAICYFQKYQLLDSNFTFLSFNPNPLTKDAWFSGFSDGDGGFSIIINKRKSDKSNYRILIQYRLEIQQIYKFNTPQDLLSDTNSFFPIMSLIAQEFHVNLLSRNRHMALNKENPNSYKLYQSYLVILTSNLSWIHLINYFNQFPLLSSKRMDYLDCCKLIELKKQYTLTKDYISQAQEIKNSLNNKRRYINWDHLN